MKLLVTGGCGFIGSHFVRHALATLPVQTLVNVDALHYAADPTRLADIANHPAYHFIQANVNDTATLRALFAQFGFTHVVHAAAHTHVDRSLQDPARFLQENTTGTLSLLQACQGQPLQRFVYVSTDEVYGELAPQAPPWTEEAPLCPSNPYAASKAGAEALVQAWHRSYGLPAVITRCGNNYGAQQFPEKLIPFMLSQALAEQPLPVYGDGQQRRDWVHVADHCQALAMLLSQGAVGQVYHISAQQEASNLAIVSALCASLDRLRPRRQGRYGHLIHHVRDRAGHDRRYALNSDKLRQATGWAPQWHWQRGGLDQVVQAFLQTYPPYPSYTPSIPL